MSEELNRRDFLKTVAASFAALTSACQFRPPEEKIVPYLDQSEAAAPGTSQWYASVCAGCSAACGVLVKSRDGRPIKVEGNPDHPLSKGGLCARGQATVLDLYDSERLRKPLAQGQSASWEALDSAVRAGLERVHKAGGRIRLLSRTLSGPSERAAAAAFLKRYPGAEHVTYDALSSSAIMDAHRLTHGRRVLPHYRFERAKAIVGFDADFLGTWISPVEFTRSWAQNRLPGRDMSWHAQFEARMSLTGSSADLRVPLRPSQEGPALAALGRRLARRTHWAGPLPQLGAEDFDAKVLDEAAERLLAAGRGKGLVVSGSQDAAAQATVNWINEMLAAYGSTVDLAAPCLQRQGDDASMDRLVDDMNAGRVGALVAFGANPAYDHPRAAAFAQGASKVGLVVALSERLDETASLAHYVGAASHALEAWNDAEPVDGVVSVAQPLVRPLFDSRPALESLLAFCGRSVTAHGFVKETWKNDVFPRRASPSTFGAFWGGAVRQGAALVKRAAQASGRFDGAALAALKKSPAPAGEFELVAYANVPLADGRQANNPWLQEMPDPVTKTTWGNCASFAPEDARRLGLEEGRVVRLSAGDRVAELPAHIQPGQAPGVVAAALGYGRTKGGRIAANYPVRKWLPIEQDLVSGADLYPLLGVAAVSVAVQAKTSPLSKSQVQDSLADPILGQKRPILQETTLAEYLKNPGALRNLEDEGNGLWPKREYKGEKWVMAVDFNLCTGCSACDVACRAENNIPVVGKAEIRKNRTMAWVRVDRYYQENPGQPSPDVSHQMVMCQQCDNAPCETVCPVIATSHTSDGLNAQVYNRCVGTRYCENNCPYKCRRFNWFDYSREDEVQNLVLNPDVTVRSRGVVEKCTFCVQRVHEARITARAEGRPIKDGEVMPACVQSCPAQALVFGDINDKKSRIAKAAEDDRGYRVLAELGVAPSVIYKTKVRNRNA